MRASLLVTLFTLLATPAYSQMPIYVGGQLGTQGIGASAEVDLGTVSVSGELGFLPIASVAFEDGDTEYSVDVQPVSGLLMANVGPAGSRFSVGVGLHFGGFNADGEATNLRGLVDIGDNEYEATAIDELLVDFEFGGVAPAVMLGLRGAGLNVGIGVAFTGKPTFSARATGPLLQNDPQFLADLQSDVDEVQEELDRVPVLPMFRIGWQIGVSGK